MEWRQETTEARSGGKYFLNRYLKCAHRNRNGKLECVICLGSFTGAGSESWELPGCRRGARLRAADVRQNQFEQIKLCSLKAPGDVLECSPNFFVSVVPIY